MVSADAHATPALAAHKTLRCPLMAARFSVQPAAASASFFGGNAFDALQSATNGQPSISPDILSHAVMPTFSMLRFAHRCR
jgi:hypothetical protein